ncbi:MAG: Ldh family oxidoreductase [Chloroflexota bacterium]|nr:Ldh family oxidoreductase [Chloroflexota bacterium]
MIQRAEHSLVVQAQPLTNFCRRVFEAMGVPPEDAEITAEVLVTANLRGIDSHGVARMRRYVEGLRRGVIRAHPEIKTLNETSVTALVDGGGGLGQPIGVRAMRMAIAKAENHGVGLVAVRNSNHYGIAGYYAMMALEHDLIGLSLTNSGPYVVPTFGREPVLGTNPISVAVPTGRERPFVLDMSTAVATLGKLEVYDRRDQELLPGWAIDAQGEPTASAAEVLRNLADRAGGGIMPLGGRGEEYGGHKGYGLALLVDILCGVLPGAGYLDRIYPKDEEGHPLPANVGHFFGALNVDAFRPLVDFQALMDTFINRVKSSAKAEGESRIFIHGEKEFEMAEKQRREGISLGPKVVASLREIAAELDVGFHLGRV